MAESFPFHQVRGHGNSFAYLGLLRGSFVEVRRNCGNGWELMLDGLAPVVREFDPAAQTVITAIVLPRDYCT